MAGAADVAEDSGVSIALTPVQLYAILNGKDISQGELASNTWHEMPLPPDYAAQRFIEALRVPVTRPDPRQDAWSRQTHYSQPHPPDCWVPPPVRRSGPPDPETVNRTTAVLDIIGGGFEIAGGALLLLAPEPTMLTKVGGSALALHGADVTQAAIRQLFSGKPVEDYTQMGSTWAARHVGASDASAIRIGVILNVAVSVGASAPEQIGKVVAIRAGRIILAEDALADVRASVELEEEDLAVAKVGGHTLREHVNVDTDKIRARALAAKNPNFVASRFFSKELADDAINDTIRAHREAMRQWALTAKPGATQKFVYDCNKVIGESYFKATGELRQVTRVRVVLRMAKPGGEPLFILTSFPDPP